MTAAMLWERFYPVAGAIIVAIAWYKLSAPFPTTPDGLLGAAATVASVFASFLGVSKAIILTVRNAPVFLKIEELGYKDDLFAYLRRAIYASIFFAVVSIVGFFIDPKVVVLAHHAIKGYELIWVLASAYSLLTYIRISSVLFKMLKQV